tara:strand:- start:341 stop:964 length:624 start_codon:yes stop_codon:yes gene_type:complete
MKELPELIIAIQKGRVLDKFLDLIKETRFQLKKNPKKTRKILIDTNTPNIKVLVVRGWDIPTYVSSGIAHLGIVGKDIIMEKESEEFIELEDLSICKCRLSLAAKSLNFNRKSKLKVATKYPNIAKTFLEEKGLQSDIIYLHGSQEIAPEMGLSDVIIDLVDSGKTLKENGLKEIEVVRDISTRLIANIASLKTKKNLIEDFMSSFN